jgi:hypothetical protein
VGRVDRAQEQARNLRAGIAGEITKNTTEDMNIFETLLPMCKAPKDGTPILVYMGIEIPYIAFVFWDSTPREFLGAVINNGEGAWVYCNELVSKSNWLVTQPMAWCHIPHPTREELMTLWKLSYN